MSDLRHIAYAPILIEPPTLRYRDDTRRVQHGNVVFMASPTSSCAWVGDDTPPDQVFALARATFGADAPFSIELDPAVAPALDAYLRDQGWTVDEEEPALVLTPLPSPVPAPPAGMTIRPARTAADIEVFAAISESRRLPSVAALTDPDIYLLLGEVDGVPVATSRAICAGGVVDITAVVTLPERRRHGYGTAMTWAAVAAGAARGCTAATLTATAMGYPIYLKMGFVPVCTLRGYAPPEGQRSEEGNGERATERAG